MARRRGDGSAVTIQSVAAHAGTSAMTVSNVLNGTGKMAEATRTRVRASVEALGYRPNTAARALASADAGRIGLVYADPQNAFLSAMLVGTLHAAAARGTQLMVQYGGAPEYESLVTALRALVRGGANALLLPPAYSEIVAGRPIIAELGVPIAAIASGRAMPGITTIRIDDRAAAQAMTDRLIERGCRRIGFVGGPDGHSSTASRLQGYRDSLEAAGIDGDPRLVVAGDFTFASGLAAGEHLLGLSRPPDAIFAASDDMAAAVVSVAHRRTLRIPADLAVAGFDDTPIAVKTWPTLTTVRQPIATMAEHATLALIGRLRRDGVAATEDVIVDFTVVERGSTNADQLQSTLDTTPSLSN